MAGGYVSFSGSSGIDHSVNASAVPFGTFVLLVTINQNLKRNYIEVQNQSVGTIQLVRDDPAPVGSGTNVTSIMCAPASAVGAQGGGWNSNTFKGRLRIYGATGSQVAAYED